ncbi:hypothetical protein PMKS-002710 [Pichia membranifaciens]|uniref:Oxidoreductase n=1 Tax=Pichia membranifaciens TaxID=4926 RepID=A0A1Q2YI54_9ASCO|nr:hypothetical protein PMKS-002710 [Pichia membranifaciens]
MDSLKIAVIGGTGGLGRAIAKNLASKGASVTVYGRTFRDTDVKNIKFVRVDLSLMSNIKKLITEHSFEIFEYDLVVFTAGIFAASKREETSEGLERDLATSTLNRYLLLEKSLPELESQPSLQEGRKVQKPRIFIMAYPGAGQLGTPDDLNQEQGYSAYRCHMNTVAGNEAIVTHYSGNKNFSIYGLNPGLVKTNIRDNYLGENSWTSRVLEFFIGWIYKSPEQYAEIITPLLTDPTLDAASGTFYNDKAKKIPASKGLTKKYADNYIRKSRELLESKGLW